MQRLVVFLIKKLLASQRLSLEASSELTGAVLDKLYALPIKDAIKYDAHEGKLYIRSRPIDHETMQVLSRSARAVLDSQALKLVREQVAFQAVTTGIHKAERPEQLYFGRAAIWWGQQEESLLELLATMGESAQIPPQ